MKTFLTFFCTLLVSTMLAQGTISGKVYAPDVAGIWIIACYPNGQGCDENLSGYVQITGSGTSAPFQIDNLQGNQYLPMAWHDSNGDGVMDQNELVIYTENGKASQVRVPWRDMILSFVPAYQRLIGSWYWYVDPLDRYFSYRFTDSGFYTYSGIREVSGTFKIENDQLTLTPSSGEAESYTVRFECLLDDEFLIFLTSNATQLDSRYTRKPTDPRQFCK